MLMVLNNCRFQSAFWKKHHNGFVLKLMKEVNLISIFICVYFGWFVKFWTLNIYIADYQEVNDPSGKKDCLPLQINHEEVAMVGLEAMERANSTLEDFVSTQKHKKWSFKAHSFISLSATSLLAQMILGCINNVSNE